MLGAFGFYYKSKRGPTAKERAIVAKCVDLCALVLEREEARAENKRLTHVDLLTGLGNRANFIQTLDAYDAGKKPLALLLIDIDSLGRINEISGHEVGDGVINQIGQTIARIAPRGMTFRVDATNLPCFWKVRLLISRGSRRKFCRRWAARQRPQLTTFHLHCPLPAAAHAWHRMLPVMFPRFSNMPI